jgi:hypothetical protein
MSEPEKTRQEAADAEHKSHEIIAAGLVRMHRLHPEKYDLEAQIVSVLGYIRNDERLFWRGTLEGAVTVCEAQGKAEAAAVLRLLLEAEDSDRKPSA